MELFTSPSKGKMSLKEVVMDILDYVCEDTSYSYKLIVGSDSHPYENETCFVSAIIIHRIGKGARYYYHKQNQKRINSLSQRIFTEAALSLDLADRLSTSLKENGQEDMPVEIHLDVGTHGATRELVKEVIGMVVGSGFDARIKPDASGASKVADRYTK
ncbi:Bacteriophage KVP40, Orf299 [Syntrophomonas zehnderi OL-4]|uniref:Bacteriophage KVP40, Orf299 n=1 Tax=Syntrophomonas zehnderi OL-4 TaxID=690567 RepID=A0A0E4C7R8_9FIRM|nr:ribonuclease H-like YkuK family protein [Syntrophomonas zehnderi]CFX09683.1 Bacteriophage KVP40, Orf299 [Syntrophomonas zehnderi OL-4]